MQDTISQRLEKAVASIRHRTDRVAETALILGSGLGGLSDAFQHRLEIPYHEIDEFPVSTAPGHDGKLVFGVLHGVDVVLLNGRFHLYEGWTPRDIALAVYTLSRLGARRMIVTNAAGALNPDYDAGDVMLIEDHLNFTGLNPLVGANDDQIGLRFPDLSDCYNRSLVALAQHAAQKAKVAIRAGIYCGVLGPSLETSAERRYFRAAGADAIGMSTVQEVIAAKHAGMAVLGLSAISNKATGGAEQQPDTVEDVLENARIAGGKIARILTELFQNGWASARGNPPHGQGAANAEFSRRDERGDLE